jgi:hypothetical protein
MRHPHLPSFSPSWKQTHAHVLKSKGDAQIKSLLTRSSLYNALHQVYEGGLEHISIPSPEDLAINYPPTYAALRWPTSDFAFAKAITKALAEENARLAEALKEGNVASYIRDLSRWARIEVGTDEDITIDVDGPAPLDDDFEMGL